jgi:hypothetical protein
MAMSKNPIYFKRYYIEHIDELKENRKKRYQDNKEEEKEKALKYYIANKKKFDQKFNCNCGGKYTFKNKSVHLKSKMHNSYLRGKEDSKKSANESESDSE